MKKLTLAVIGQGRSGKDIHGKYYRSEENVYFDVKYVVDEDEYRRKVSEEIYPGCVTYGDYRELFRHRDIDIVVNSTYSNEHYSITKDLLLHGFNVLVEKPMSRTRFECEDLIRTAKDRGLLLAVFQQTFYAEYYAKAKEMIASGVLGEIRQINLRNNGFARRWDWQTLQWRTGGSLYNTGPHPVGLALGFLDFDPATRVAYAKLQTALTSGDADDCVKLILEAPGKPAVDLEINSNDAYPEWPVKILGTRGTMELKSTEYKMTYIVDGENPDRPVTDRFIENEQRNPAYCRETLVRHEESGTLKVEEKSVSIATAGFYKELYEALTEGKPMTITAEIARDIIAVIEQAHAVNPLPRIF